LSPALTIRSIDRIVSADVLTGTPARFSPEQRTSSRADAPSGSTC
jgi:hypothetical protein